MDVFDHPLRPLTEEEKEAIIAKQETAEQLARDQQSLDWWLKQEKTVAGELLLKKAMVLLGVSAELGEGSERGQRIKKEADELMSFAKEIQTSEEASTVVTSAHKFISELNAKYSDIAAQTTGIRTEGVRLWDSIASSSEADELVKHSKALLADWSKYAKTDEGQSMMNKAQDLLKSQGSTVISAIDAASPTGEQLVHKEKLKETFSQVTDVGKEIHNELKQDEDVALLISKAQKDIAEAVASAKNAAHESILSPKKSDKDASTSSISGGTLSTPSGDLSFDKLSDDQKNALTLMQGEKYLRELRENEVGRKLLAQGTAYLASGQLRPDVLLSTGNKMYTDTEARKQFINKVKDSALEFLMAYLPTATVPPLEGNKENVDYRLENVDLSGFKVLNEDVFVDINDADGLVIEAKNINCEMKNLRYAFKKTTFPKFSGDGTAYALAEGVKFSMKLQLETPGRSFPNSPMSKSSNSKSSDSVPSVISSRSLQTPQKSPQLPPFSPRTPTNVSEASNPSISAKSGLNLPALNTSPAFLEQTSSSSTLTALTTPISSDTAPRLVLKHCVVTLATFQIKITSGSSLKSIYNMLLKLFSSTVREYIEVKLNSAINEKSSQLLGTINTLAADYLPLLQRIMLKADAVVKKKTGKSVVERVRDRESPLSSPLTSSPRDVSSPTEIQSPTDEPPTTTANVIA